MMRTERPRAIDSDATMRSIMDFLTMKPEDTADEYFADYTPEQLAFCAIRGRATVMGDSVEIRFPSRCIVIFATVRY